MRLVRGKAVAKPVDAEAEEQAPAGLERLMADPRRAARGASKPAAAPAAPEPELPQRHIAPAGGDQRLEVGVYLVLASRAPDQEPQAGGVRGAGRGERRPRSHELGLSSARRYEA